MARSVKYRFGKLNNRDDSASLGYFSDKRSPLITTMVEATNVEIYDGESASRRGGYTEKNPVGGHSLFCTKDGVGGFLVVAEALHQLNLDFTTTALAPLANNSRMWMEEINGMVLASNGTDLLLVSNGAIIPMPSPAEQHEIPFPACRFLTFFKGVIYGATADGIVMTKAYSLLSDERHFLIPLANVSMIAAVDDGLWVGTTDKVYWLGGKGDDEFTLKEVFPYGVISGAFSQFNAGVISDSADKELAVIMATPEGICIGRGAGSLDNISIDDVAIGGGSSGCCYVRETEGGAFFLVAIEGTGGRNIFTGTEFVTNEQTYT